MDGLKSKSLLFLILSSALSLSACNFFGKQVEPTPTPIGQIGNGASVVGTWVTLYSAPSTTSEPSYALTNTFIFEPTGVAKIELEDFRLHGGKCSAYGQYRAVGQDDIVIYIQSYNSPSCAFNGQIHWSAVKVYANRMKIQDPESKEEFTVYADNTQRNTSLVGVWKFGGAGGDSNGDGGIDYIFFDSHGYFILQTTESHEQFLLIGFYKIEANGSVILSFFQGSDPAQVYSSMSFKQFVTDGANLDLVDQSEDGDVVYSGTRL